MSPASGLDPALPADTVARLLELAPHPEGGRYRETFRDPATDERGRARSSAILFLLSADETSEWHRVDAAEMWFWHAGGPLALTISPDGHDATSHRLGPHLGAGQSLQAVVPANAWQTATSLGAWTLVSCVVAPAFLFERFELAPPGWRPTPRDAAGQGVSTFSSDAPRWQS